jgi:hypothetical protein
MEMWIVFLLTLILLFPYTIFPFQLLTSLIYTNIISNESQYAMLSLETLVLICQLENLFSLFCAIHFIDLLLWHCYFGAAG